jgi:hypothetical protein
MTGIRTAVFPVAGRSTRFLPATNVGARELEGKGCQDTLNSLRELAGSATRVAVNA